MGPSASRFLSLALALASCAAFPGAARADAETSPHPLDGLTYGEHWAVYETLVESGRLEPKARFAAVSLREPPKSDVRAWKPGKAARREALAVIRQGGRTFEAVVDAGARRLASWREVPDAQPGILSSEEETIEEIVKENPDVVAALKRRGLTDLNTVHCWGAPAGYFGEKEFAGRRLVRAECWEGRGAFRGGGSPIEGLVALLDLDARRVLEVTDTGAVPLAEGRGDYDRALSGPRRQAPAPLRVEQPLGPGFSVRGQEVTWQKWRFHFRVDARRALVVSDVRYEDGGRQRSVLYQGSLSEIYVPYMDPSAGWFFLAYIDMGEYGTQELISSIAAGLDCPAHAVLFDAVLADERGQPGLRPRAACLFERASGDVAWRHDGDGRGLVESRPRRDLVLRTLLVIGNYDYVLDWVFRQDGVIEVEVGATGFVAVKAVPARSFAQDGGGRPIPDGRDDPYGRYVSGHTVAVNHDHYFAFRLDLDVDGATNRLVVDQIKVRRMQEPGPRRSLWVVEPRVARTEHEAMLHMSMDEPALWRFVNAEVKGRLGYPVSYEIRPGHNAMPLLPADEFPQSRAGFIEHNLWVTPYRAEELYAAGDYPVQSRAGEGLPAWTAANRPIEDTDIVAWYTVGFHHVVRAEDWPVTPNTKHGFELRPFDFFDGNPAMDLPKGP